MSNSPLNTAVDYVYSSNEPCHLIPELTSSNENLVSLLLPSTVAFGGDMHLSKVASGNGCELYLTVKGAMPDEAANFQDAFEVAEQIDQKLMEQLKTKGLEGVALTRTVVMLGDNKVLAMSLASKQSDVVPETVPAVHEGECAKLLSALRCADLFPQQVEAAAFNVTQQTDAKITTRCEVGLGITAKISRLDADMEVFHLLKVVNKKLDDFFDEQPNATLTNANVQLQLAQTLALKPANKSTTEKMLFNAPSYGEALGIFTLVAVLMVMMLSVLVQKKHNDKRCRERYERANRAAQIRRVSIRMSQYDQENTGEEDIGEEDSLL